MYRYKSDIRVVLLSHVIIYSLYFPNRLELKYLHCKMTPYLKYISGYIIFRKNLSLLFNIHKITFLFNPPALHKHWKKKPSTVCHLNAFLTKEASGAACFCFYIIKGASLSIWKDQQKCLEYTIWQMCFLCWIILLFKKPGWMDTIYLKVKGHGTMGMYTWKNNQ